MGTGTKALILIAATASLPVLAQEETGKLSCIKDITYSQEFLARYPKAGAACREVVMRDGEKWVRFEADVVKVDGNHVTTDFMDTYGNQVARLTFAATPDARVDVEGRSVKYSDLEPGDKLTFWAPEKSVGFYAAPGAARSTQLSLVTDSGATLK